MAEVHLRNREQGEVLPLSILIPTATESVTSREIAIEKWQQDNAGGKNDRKISDSYRQLSTTYSALGPTYNVWRLEELQHATEADKTNINAWNDRIKALEDSGMTTEAEQVKHQRDLTIESEGGHGFMDFLLPASPLIPILGIALVMMGLATYRRRSGIVH